MKICQYSAAGSIRENNQDRLKTFDDLHLAVVADGYGASGENAAEMAIARLALSLKQVAHVTNPEQADEVLLQHVTAACADAEQRFTASGCDMAALWVNRTATAAVATGKCALICIDQDKAHNTNRLNLPNARGLSFILCSEGAAIQAGDGRVIPRIESALQAPSHENLNGLGELMSAVYDGDDCSMLLIITDETDQIYPREIELISHIDKEYSFPLWMPVSVAGGVGLAAALLAKKALSLSRRVLKS